MEKIPEVVYESWHRHLQVLFDSNEMKYMKYELLPKTRFYPEGRDIFNVFRMPLDRIKVVILGQDPYKNKNEAIGYAFAVPPTTKVPPSLEIIMNELVRSKPERATVGIDNPEWRTLKHWRQQGIFLLNVGLTIGAGADKGVHHSWRWFTTEVIKIISLYNTPTWLIWGSIAKSCKGSIHKYYEWRSKGMGLEYNYTLTADHPASELYLGSHHGFSGCNHFNLCNEILKYKKQSVINW